MPIIPHYLILYPHIIYPDISTVGRRRPLHWDAPPSSCPANANLGGNSLGDGWIDHKKSYGNDNAENIICMYLP